MKNFKKAFGFIFSIVAGILVLLSLVLVTPFYFIIFLTAGKKAEKYAVRVSRIWASIVLISCGVRLKVYNRNVIDPNRTYIIISNHRSYLDIPICARCTTLTFKFLAKAELTKIPLLGYIIKRLYITVRRQSMRDRVNAIKKMESEINRGISVWIYPEGTRNSTSEPLTEFQDGAFTLAVNTGRPILVLTIMDTRKLLPPGTLFQVIPGKVTAWWEKPIETTELTKKDIPALKDTVKQLMLKYM
jgi:1-acyl-sn-glycerol-3-phosphate acyltransferase